MKGIPNARSKRIVPPDTPSPMLKPETKKNNVGSDHSFRAGEHIKNWEEISNRFTRSVLSPANVFLTVTHPHFWEEFPWVPLGHWHWKVPGKFKQMP